MNYRIERKDPIRILGRKIALSLSLEENFKITPAFWQECTMDGTIEKLSAMMDTDLYGMMGVCE